MPERPIGGRLVDSGVIAGIAARTARETPGVLRVEPAPARLLARWRISASRRMRSTAAWAARRPGNPDAAALRDGVVAFIENGRATVEVDLATDAAFNAVDVADLVRTRVARALGATGIRADTVNVTVLAIERAPEA